MKRKGENRCKEKVRDGERKGLINKGKKSGRKLACEKRQ